MDKLLFISAILCVVFFGGFLIKHAHNEEVILLELKTKCPEKTVPVLLRSDRISTKNQKQVFCLIPAE